LANINSNILKSENICIDVTMLYTISANDEDFIFKIVNTFLKTFPDTIKKIEESLSEADWEKVYLNAHHAKSSLSIIKIDEMFDWVLQVESNAKNQTDLDTIPDLVKKIKGAYLFAEDLLHSNFIKS
jgi:HPt (histidine-containing phosphotransfer) domain-containing protein